MRSIVDAFHEGGSFMYLVLLLGLAGLAVAILGLALGLRSRRLALRLGGAALGLGLLTMLVGWLGYRSGLSQMEAALGGVDPSMHAMLQAQGEKEAAQNLRFGALACALPVLVGFGLLARGATQPEDGDPALPG